MKKLIYTAAICLGATTCGNAHADTIKDNYIGGAYYNGKTYPVYQDSLDNDSRFDISKIETTQSSNTMTVDVYTNYTKNIGLLDTTLGDLWLSTNGYQNTSKWASTKDTYQTGEQWEYALKLDSYDTSATQGNLYLYAVSGTSDYTLAEETGTTNFRYGQESLYDTSNGATGVLAGTWTLTDYGISYSFDLTLLSGLGDELGLRWQMSCANDIIEGEVSVDPVPEPATMLLFGTGLASIAGFQIRRKKNS
jgi:hypothetical protein